MSLNSGPRLTAPRRVVITGMGAVSAYGAGVEALFNGLRAGRSAVVDMSGEWREQVPDLSCTVGAPLRAPLNTKAIPRRLRRTMGPMAVMAYLASAEAIEQAGLGARELTSGRLGISYGSTTGSVIHLEEGFRAYVNRRFMSDVSTGNFFQIMSHTCAANLAHGFGVKGRVIAPNAACASSTLAIGLAYETIRDGQQELMLAGGADELHPVVVGCFDLVQASSCRFNDQPSRTPRPFDRDRDGTVCGEGAGTVVLEAEESARARGATILAEVVGFATCCDGTHLAQPRTESVVRCMESALDNAQLAPNTVDYINAHGTGTPMGDAAEAEAIARLFGPDSPPVSSLKGHLGHTLGASGALELIASLEMMRSGALIPTLNLDAPGEDCEGVRYVAPGDRAVVNALVKNSFAFGGVNAVMVITRYGNER